MCGVLVNEEALCELWKALKAMRSWSNALILDLAPDFNRLRKDNFKERREKKISFVI